MEVTFITKIVSMGEDRRIITIPKAFFHMIQEMEDKSIEVTIRGPVNT